MIDLYAFHTYKIKEGDFTENPIISRNMMVFREQTFLNFFHTGFLAVPLQPRSLPSKSLNQLEIKENVDLWLRDKTRHHRKPTTMERSMAK